MSESEPRPAAGFHLMTIGGTAVDVRPSFVILAVLFVFLDLDSRVPIQKALLWIPVLLLSVLIHEFAHAGTIALFGHGASRIELGGWGGQTINRRITQPWQEVLISVAGPVTSLALGAICFVALNQLPPAQTPALLFAFIRLMTLANIAWGVFNLIPIYPLDGGQILLNALFHLVSRANAFVATTWISMALGVTLGASAAFFAHQYFAAIIAASLVFQNWSMWQEWRRHRAEHERPAMPPDN